jgi:hypothetical protein
MIPFLIVLRHAPYPDSLVDAGQCQGIHADLELMGVNQIRIIVKDDNEFFAEVVPLESIDFPDGLFDDGTVFFTLNEDSAKAFANELVSHYYSGSFRCSEHCR